MLLKNIRALVLNRHLAILFCLLAIGQSFYSLGRIILFGRLFDFWVYREAVVDFTRGLNPYLNTAFNFNYPPTSLLLFLPLTAVSFTVGEILWTIFSGLTLVLAGYLISRRAPAPTFYWLIGFALLSFPVKFTLGMGQVNLIVLLLLTLTLHIYRRRPLAAGFAFAFAVAIKITPVLLLPLFLLQKQYRLFFGSLLSLLGIAAFSLMFTGWSVGWYYLTRVFPMLFGFSGKEVYYNQAFSGFVARLFGDSLLAGSLSVVFTIFILATCFIYWLKNNFHRSFCFGMITILLISGFSWQHHFVFLLPVFYLALAEFSRRFRPLLLISLLLVSFNVPTIPGYHYLFPVSLLLSHVFAGTLLLWLVYLLAGSSKPEKVSSLPTPKSASQESSKPKAMQKGR